MNRATLLHKVSNVNSSTFEEVALDLFKFQYRNNSVYRGWVDSFSIDANSIERLDEVPFLPISAFKNNKVSSINAKEQKVFRSSGTTGSSTSNHYVYDMQWYLDNAERIFSHFYGAVSEFCFLALLPSYLERTGSSLISMVDAFVKKSSYKESGFYLYNHAELHRQLEYCQEKGIPTVLFGVSFALLDFLDDYKIDFPELIVIETGGMKGRKKEMSRENLHQILSFGFGVFHVNSEYGMTELLSQGYSKTDGVFHPGKTMKLIIKETTDPLNEVSIGKTGIVNIVDLANVDSCAFIETQDLGKIYSDGSFEILGRMDQSDIRGCNLMVGDFK